MINKLRFTFLTLVIGFFQLSASSSYQRLVMLFDDHARATKQVQPIDATTIDLLAVLHDKTTPLLVSTSVVARLFDQAALFANPSICTGGPGMKSQISAAKQAFDGLMASAQQYNKTGLTPAAREQLQQKLGNLSNSSHVDVLEGLLPCYVHEFKASEWTVKKVGQDLVLMIPHAYATIGTEQGKKDVLTELEYTLGLKVDHLPTVDLVAHLKNYRQPIAHPWTIAESVFATKSNVFVTVDEYKKAGKKPGTWLFIMLGHGFQYTYQEYVGLFKKQTIPALEKTLKVLSGMKPLCKSFEERLESVIQAKASKEQTQAIFEEFDGSFTDHLQQVADAIAWAGPVLQDSYLPYIVQKLSHSLHQAANKGISSDEREQLRVQWRSLTDFIDAAISFMTDAVSSKGCQQPTGGRTFADQLVNGRFCGLFHDQFAQALRFFDTNVQTQLLFYVTCYGGGAKRDHIFDALLGKKPLSYTVIAGSLTEAPARGLSYQLFDAGANIKIENGAASFVLPYPKDFKKAFEGFAQQDVKKFIGAVDKVHPILPVRNWVNNLPFIRQAGSTTFSLLLLDGSVQTIDGSQQQVASTDQPQVCLVFKSAVDELSFAKNMPALVPMMATNVCDIKKVNVAQSTLDSFVGSCYSVEAHKKQYTYTIDTLLVKAGSLAKALGVAATSVVELRNVALSHNKNSAGGLLVDTLTFNGPNGKKYAGSFNLTPDIGISNTSQLLKSVRLV